jgi:hypothetical protein
VTELFREDALARHAQAQEREEPLREISARLRAALWLCAALLAAALLALASYIAALID